MSIAATCPDCRTYSCICTKASPVTITVPLDALREVHAALVECGQDLQCSVDAEYASRMDYPTEQRRHARDREPANRALHLAQAMQTWEGFNLSSLEGQSDG